jgi:hypothetical protein
LSIDTVRRTAGIESRISSTALLYRLSNKTAQQSNRSTRFRLSAAGLAAFSGTQVYPARQIPRMQIIASGLFGANTATFASAGRSADRNAAARRQDRDPARS